MKLLAKDIKKVMLGICLSDASISETGRFDFYSKNEEYAKYVFNVISEITGTRPKYYVKYDKRGYTGYRVTAPAHVYLKKLREKVYDGRKELNKYTVSRINDEALAHIWMCDGYLEHAKNRAINRVQNIGWLCFEAFPDVELKILQEHLQNTWGISSSLVSKPWGFGYRVRIGGSSLQKLISVVYPYILDCFKYKTPLFYRKKESADMSLPSAEQFVFEYETVEDIVRHSTKVEKT